MQRTSDGFLVLESRHTGERLQLRRLRGSDGAIALEVRGSLPPGQEGPPLHIHVGEDEHGEVVSGTLSASLDGVTRELPAGSEATFPRGSAHRWWNAGDKTLRFRGTVSPLLDLDRFLQAVFDVMNSGPEGRPPLFYMAHALRRHRKTQVALVMPPVVQRVLFPAIIFLGRILGKYRGSDWPGCPERCVGAPEVVVEEV